MPPEKSPTAVLAQPRAGHRFYYGWAIVFASLAVMAVVVGLQHTFGVFFKPLLQDFGWTRAVTAGIFSLGSILQGVTAILVGLVSDRYGPRRLVLICGVLVGLSFILASWSTALWQLYLYFGLLQGIGRGIPFNPLMATLARWFTQRRGLALGLALSGGGVGTIFFPMLSSFLVERFNWQTAFLVFGFVSGGVVIAGALLLRARPPQAASPLEAGAASEAALSSPNKHGEESTPLAQVWVTPAFWLVLAAGFLSNFSITVVFVHLVPYATDLKIPAAVAASFVSMIGVFNILGKIGMGIFADRYGVKRGMVICFSLGAATMLWLTQASELWMFYLFAAFFGLAYAGWIPLFPALVGQIFGVGSMAAVLGFLTAANTVGGALGAYLAGYLFDVTQSYQQAFILSAVALAIVVPCQLLVKTPRQLAPRVIGEVP